MILILSGEHCGNIVPESYSHCFQGSLDVLSSHRGYDIGSLDLFDYLTPLASFSHHHLTSRLLIEVNRSVHHKSLFSEFTKNLPKHQKEELLKDVYYKYRDFIENKIKLYIHNGESVLHISVHSFTPVLNTIVRNCDIGLLYDPKRVDEKRLASELKRNILIENSSLKIRYNYPYLGTADGFTTYLRRQFKENYVGIELEVNQKFTKNNQLEPKIKTNIYNSLAKILECPLN